MKKCNSFIVFCLLTLMLSSCNVQQTCDTSQLRTEIETLLREGMHDDPRFTEEENEVYLERYMEDVLVLSEVTEKDSGDTTSCNCTAVVSMDFTIDPEVLKFIRLQGESTSLEDHYRELRKKRIIVDYSGNNKEAGICTPGDLVQTYKEYVVMQSLLDQIDEIVNSMPGMHRYEQP